MLSWSRRLCNFQHDIAKTFYPVGFLFRGNKLTYKRNSMLSTAISTTKFKHVTSWGWFLFGGLRLFCIKLHSLLISKSSFKRPCNENKNLVPELLYLHIFPRREREVPGTKFPTLVNVNVRRISNLVFLIQKSLRIC